MAKRKHNRRGGYAATNIGKHTGAKIIAGLAFLLVVAYVITSLALGMQWNPLKWGKANTPAGNGKITTEETIIPQDLGCMVLTTANAERAPLSLAAARTVSNNSNVAYLTATLNPADADYSDVKWTASNTGIVITPFENDPLSVQVTMSGQIFFTETITCEIKSVKTLTATCNVDLLCFPTRAVASLSDNLIKFNAINTLNVYFDRDSSDMGGTVTDYECRLTTAEICLSAQTVERINSYLGYSGNSWDYSAGGLDTNGNFVIASPRLFAGSELNYVSDENFRKAFFAACNGKTDCAELYVGVDLVYQGKTYKSYNCTVEVGFASSSYAVGLEGVEIGDIVFTK